MKKTLFYPFNSKDIPFVRYFSAFQDMYILSHVCAARGTGLIGCDISHADDRNNVGIIVEEFSEKILEDSDVLLISDNATEYNLGKICNIIEKAIELTYLFLEAEKRFDIIIPFDMVQNYEFNSVNSIAKIIEALLKKAKPREGCCL